ncbi:hypothetical protein EDD22DRAFT_542170 [Suillus occidentalis]|nr:hypothetical protein EDD22DRAFT_542170 [Suillus occidentalis]
MPILLSLLIVQSLCFGCHPFPSLGFDSGRSFDFDLSLCCVRVGIYVKHPQKRRMLFSANEQWSTHSSCGSKF